MKEKLKKIGGVIVSFLFVLLCLGSVIAIKVVADNHGSYVNDKVQVIDSATYDYNKSFNFAPNVNDNVINFASNKFNPTLNNFTYDAIPTRYIANGSNATISFNIGNSYGNNFVVGMKKVGGGYDDSYGFYIINEDGNERRYTFNSINNYRLSIQHGFKFVSFWATVNGYYDFELYFSNVNNLVYDYSLNQYNDGISKGYDDGYNSWISPGISNSLVFDMNRFDIYYDNEILWRYYIDNTIYYEVYGEKVGSSHYIVVDYNDDSLDINVEVSRHQYYKASDLSSDIIPTFTIYNDLDY